MSDQRFNTGNPIGSNSPLDRSDNTRNLDLAVQSLEDTFQDRMGRSRLTWAGIVKAGSGDAGVIVPIVQQAVQDVIAGVDGQVAVAQSAADRAEDAYVAIYNSGALQSSSIYETITEGLDGTSDGEYFWVYPNNLNSIENLTLFKRVDAMTEELLFVQYNLNEYMSEEGAEWETEQ